MINEYQFEHIVNNVNISNNNIYSNKLIQKKNKNVKNFGNIFKFLISSPLKTYINKIYNNFKIPKESLIISMYYLFQCKKKNNIINLKDYILTAIIIANKQLIDYNIDTAKIYNILNIDKKIENYKEITLLKILDWDTFYDTKEYKQFKMYLVHYMDWYHMLD